MIRKRGNRYEVRWTEGGRKRGRTFARKGDADAFELEVKRRRQLGALAPTVIQSRQTLARFMEEEWWPRYAIPNLAPDTRRRYLEVWGTHVWPRLGDGELREITPLVVEDLRDQMAHVGVGVATQRKALMLLQGILKRAVVRGLIPSNPVQVVGKPRQAPTLEPRPLAPETVERIRARLRHRDATIVGLLAYAGLRPAEDRGLRWGDLRERTLRTVSSKTGRERRVDLLAPVVQDLLEWRLASHHSTGPRDLIIPRPTGGDWTREDWANWRRRILASSRAGGRGGGRLAAVPSARLVRVAAALGGAVAYLRRRAGRPLRRDAR